MTETKDIDFKTISRDDLLKVADSDDPMSRKQISSQLIALGLKPPAFLRWSPEQKVDYIIENTLRETGGAKASTKTTGGAKTKAANPAAAKASTATTSGSVTGGPSNAAVLEAIGALSEKLDAVIEYLPALQAYAQETHFLSFHTAAALGADVSDTSGLGDFLFQEEEAGNDEG